MPTPPYSPAQIEISIPTASYDGRYWGRYPNGDKPTGLAGSANVGVSGGADLLTRAQLVGGASVDSAASGVLSGASGSKIKWNPGWYSGSDGLLNPGDTLSGGFITEMDIGLGIANGVPQDHIIGWRSLVRWGHLDIGPQGFTGSVGGGTSGTLTAAVANGTYYVRFSNGNFRDVTVTGGTACSWSSALSSGNVTSGDFYILSTIDAIQNRCITAYNKPKHYVMSIIPFTFNGGTRNAGDGSCCPNYIAANSAMGAAPAGGSGFGWWGVPPGQSVGVYTAAIYRTAVAQRYALLGDALGHRYNSNPYFEAICDQENSGVLGAAKARYSFGPPAVDDPTYSDDNYTNCLKNIIYPAWRAAFPNVSIVAQNTFLNGVDKTQQFATWMMANAIACGTADCTGDAYISTHGNFLTNWGLEAYAGQKDPNNTDALTYPDRRGQVACMLDLEAPDWGTNPSSTFGAAKRPNTPQDLITALLNRYKPSHVFWAYLSEASTTPHMTWAANVTTLLKNNPLQNIGYPGNYP
jgi:hypothetical protein